MRLLVLGRMHHVGHAAHRPGRHRQFEASGMDALAGGVRLAAARLHPGGSAVKARETPQVLQYFGLPSDSVAIGGIGYWPLVYRRSGGRQVGSLLLRPGRED